MSVNPKKEKELFFASITKSKTRFEVSYCSIAIKMVGTCKGL